MKIVKAFPPNIAEISGAFDLSGGEIFCYGDTIYNPDGNELPEWLIKHEEVHQKQQGDDVTGWWERYLIDPEWRLEQEMEAHIVEFRWFRRLNKNRELHARYLSMIAGRLASKMYGNVITKMEAQKQIRRRA